MESNIKPNDRHEALAIFSREHHHCLLLCWKIRKGLSGDVSFERIQNYSKWFYIEYLKFLFKDEEKYLVPILGKDHKLIKKMLSEHRRLRRLFKAEQDLEKALHNLEEELERNIRFKERDLFQVVQELATTQQLQNILNNRKEVDFVENLSDIFWED